MKINFQKNPFRTYVMKRIFQKTNLYLKKCFPEANFTLKKNTF